MRRAMKFQTLIGGAAIVTGLCAVRSLIRKSREVDSFKSKVVVITGVLVGSDFAWRGASLLMERTLF